MLEVGKDERVDGWEDGRMTGGEGGGGWEDEVGDGGMVGLDGRLEKGRRRERDEGRMGGEESGLIV